ncbi:MAG: phosphotransferase family protein [Caulobacter sp.]|nr:phosphotransferase family protein [Caulobacter sp.]
MSEENSVPEGVDLAVLTAFMDAHKLGEGPLTDLIVLTGGTQNILLKFTRAGRAFVLRRPPPKLRANSNETMRREARVLAALAGSDVPHPGLIAACPEETMDGAAFYLMEPIDGFNPTVGLPALHAGDPAVRHRMGLALVDGIVALSRIDIAAVGLQSLGKSEGWLERQAPRWKAQFDSYAAFPDWCNEIPGVDEVGAWLEAHRPARFRPGLIHGDYHLANVMYRHDSGELAAIVDWELASVGDPLLDLGWLMAMWPEPGAAAAPVTPWDGFPTIEEVIARYGEGSGRDLTDLAWYGVLACYKLGIILEGSHARASAGQAPKAIGDRLHASTLNLFQRALRWIA